MVLPVVKNGANTLTNYRRNLPALLPVMPLNHASNETLASQVYLLLIINKYRDIEGIISLEETLKTVLGLEIIDEADRAADIQKVAKNLLRRRGNKSNDQLIY